MNHLVTLDPCAGELEKILSGVKTMLVKEVDPSQAAAHPVNPGDSLYFLKGKDDCTLRVQAAVVRVLSCSGPLEECLKEMQPRLQLTEDQYNYWSQKGQVQLVEFDAAHKIGSIQVDPVNIKDRPVWIALEVFSQTP